MKTIRFVVTVLFLIDMTSAQLDTSVCTPSPPTTNPAGPSRPSVSNMFSVHIACVIRNKNKTIDVHEFFDFPHNRGKIEQWVYGNEFDGYYDYSTDEFIEVNPKTHKCELSPLSKTGQRFLLGDKGPGPSGHIFTAANALHIGNNSNETYTGTSVVRGITVDSWYSCQYWPSLKATMNVTWYFSHTQTWDMALGEPSTPVRCHVTGRVRSSSTQSYSFDHIYDFFHFKNFIQDPSTFETPRQTSCPGRKNTRPLPMVPIAMTFTTEVIDEVFKKVTFTTEKFDAMMKLMVYQKRNFAIAMNKYGTDPIKIVKDFNTGVEYVIDMRRGNCSTSAITANNIDSLQQDSHNVRMSTAWELFHFDGTYTYEGIKSVRSVDCDTWVSSRTDFPPGQNSTWEWSFISANWTSLYDEAQTYASLTPMQVRVTVPFTGAATTYNIYQFSANEPDILDMDVRNCYVTKRRVSFQFAFTDTGIESIKSKMFKYNIVNAVIQLTGVSPLRVSNLQGFLLNTTQMVSFDLLDVAPVKGDVAGGSKEPSLDTAANDFSTAVKANRLIIIVMGPKGPEYRSAVPSSLRFQMVGPYQVQPTHGSQTHAPQTHGPQTHAPQTHAPPTGTKKTPFGSTQQNYLCNQQSTSGYSAGVMAGVSVAMVIVGGALGAGLAILLSRKR